MTILPSSLLLLIAMRHRAAWRRLARSLRTPKGILLAVAAVGGTALWMVPMIAMAVSGRQPKSPIADGILPFGPFIILGFLVLSLIRTPGDQALAFLQAEVDLLFSAPFTRLNLLAYKLTQRIAPLLFVSLIFSLWARLYAHSWLAAWVGVALILWFLHLCALCLALLGQLFGKRRFVRVRRLVGVTLLVVVVGGAWWTSRSLDTRNALDMLRTFAESDLGKVVAAPAVPFARAFSARAIWPDLAYWAAISLAINAALLVAAVRLDANWLEAGAESSRKLNERLDEFRRTGGMPSRGKGFSFVRLPMPPRFFGIGPLAWRQALTGIRQGMRGLLVMVIILAAMIVPQLFREHDTDGWAKAFRPVSYFLLGYMSLSLPQLLRLDFRGDADRMDLLKALPVSPFVLAAAQIAVPASIITLAQIPLAIALDRLMAWELEAIPIWAVALFAANLLIAALENALFLLWPVRPKPGVGMGFASAQIVVQILKMIALVVLIGAAAGLGTLTATVSGGGAWAAAPVVAVVFAVEAGAMVVLVARLFAKFDPSKERLPDA